MINGIYIVKNISVIGLNPMGTSISIILKAVANGKMSVKNLVQI